MAELTFLSDPNILYILLMASLWFAAVAVATPGTGVLEIAALILSIGVLFLLGNVSTNWAAVVIIVCGALLYHVVPFFVKRARPVMYGGLILQVIASFVLFNDLSVSLAIIAVVTFSSFLYHRFILEAAINTRDLKPAMLDDQPLIGEQGYVQSKIDPIGTVRVRGETWSARSTAPIETGQAIVVVEQDGLTLFVEPEKHKRRAAEI
ncbi:MAG: hypothetical protein IAE89_04350 [Anaerolineae bacterium]|nr:hypothetical protein [Anaerolineae bacterium]